MEKLFCILALFLSLQSSANAGGLFSGCMSSGFGTNSWRADTEAYISRVEADGGVVINEQMVNDAYQLLADHSLTPLAWVDANFGVKKDGSDYVSKLYDLTSNNYDATQATSSAQPKWYANQQNSMASIFFDGGDFLTEGTNLGKPSSYTSSMIIRATDISTSPQYVWANYGAETYSYWYSALKISGASNGALSSCITNQAGTVFTYAYTAGSTINATDYYLISDRYATGASTLYKYVDTASKSFTYADTSATTNSGTSNSFSIGRLGNFNGGYFNGYIGSFCMFNSSLSDTDRGYVESFLNNYYATY